MGLVVWRGGKGRCWGGQALSRPASASFKASARSSGGEGSLFFRRRKEPFSLWGGVGHFPAADGLGEFVSWWFINTNNQIAPCKALRFYFFPTRPLTLTGRLSGLRMCPSVKLCHSTSWFLSSERSFVCPLTLGEIKICLMLPRKPCFHTLLWADDR